jgi:hypothetical protein
MKARERETAPPMNPSLTKSAFASSKGDLGVSFLWSFFVQGEFFFLGEIYFAFA